MAHETQAALDQDSVEDRLQELAGWQLDTGRDHHVIARTFTFPTYADGIAFAVKVGMLAERMNHHPDALEIQYKRVRVCYTTHDAGGITERDFDAALRVSQL